MSNGPIQRKSILLVDDSDRIRLLVRAILEDLQCDVLEAEDGEIALRVAAAAPVPIDLLITDFQMPGMSVLKLAEQLRQSAPGMKVLCMSGYGFPQTSLRNVHFI